MTDQPTDGPEVIDSSPETENTDPVEQDQDSPTPVSDDNAASGATQDIPETRRDKRIEQLSGDNKLLREFGTLQQEGRQKAEQERDALKAAAEVPPPEMPMLEAFGYDDKKFAVAKQAWDDNRIDRRVKEGLAQGFQQQTQAATATQADAAWEAKLQAFRTEHADFDQVVFANKPTVDALKALNLGPEIPYYLVDHPEEAAVINSLTGDQLKFELGKLSVSMGESPSSPETVPRKQTTTAPDPMSPVGGGQPTVSTADLPIDDWMKMRNAKDKTSRNIGGRIVST